jgi:MYXO-CTERM domain-containing protein
MREYRLGVLVALAIALWSGRAHAAFSITGNPIDCGSVVIGGSTTCSETLSNSNSGMYDLFLDASCDTDVWSISPTAVNLNSSKEITATFTPSASGVSSCTVHVTDKMTTSPDRFTFSLRGNGQLPANISVSVTDLAFGSARYNDASPSSSTTKTLSVANTGDVPLMITGVTIGGANASSFSIQSGGTSGTINKGTPKLWTFEFDPNSPAGDKTATVTFMSNDTTSGTVVVDLAGTSTTASIDVSATTVDYGVVANGSSRTNEITVKNPMVTFGGPLGVTRALIAGGTWFTFASCATPTNRDCGSVLAIPNNGQALIGVKCSPPPGATGDQMATVTFTSDSDSGTANVANLTCTSGNINVAAAMSEINFGSKLVVAGGGAPVSAQMMVTNKGTLDATIAFALSSGTPGQFTVTCTGGASSCMVPKNDGTADGATMIDLTFTPTAEGDLFTNLDINLNGGNQNGPSVSLVGRGIDKHLDILTDIEFTDTFRNPGDKAPLQIVPIKNYGEYDLQVTEMTITGDPVWSLAEPFMPFTVPPKGSVDVNVRFAPTDEGKAPPGTLTVASNDILPTGTQTITLLGTGKLRNVDMAPGSVDVGETFAGIDARLSITRPGEILTVINQDTETFNIRDLKIEGTNADMFTLVNIDGSEFTSIDIEPGASQTFDVIFSPPYPGDFEASIVLYLDQDPIAQQPVPIRGHALYIEAYGGGGCSTGGDTRGGALLLVAGVLVILRRRRR